MVSICVLWLREVKSEPLNALTQFKQEVKVKGF